MSYKKAAQVLPEELLAQIQEYIQGIVQGKRLLAFQRLDRCCRSAKSHPYSPSFILAAALRRTPQTDR